ncbi:PRC-barrel domain-containing protein [Jannaschia rubra]|nr:PRC-barrel domain-containing protein [Jannaschia rubra]
MPIAERKEPVAESLVEMALQTENREIPMTTHKLLLGSVATAALLATGAFAQDATTPTDDAQIVLDADGNPIDADATTGAMGGQIVVEQPDADVDVTVADPTVTVDQARPEVLVEQAEPEITVTVAEPTVTVEQQAPIITIEQAQPEVLVTIPEPVVTVRMPEPDVNVSTSQPEISVDQPEPIVRFVRPEPRITIEEAEPQVNVTSAEPEVRVNRADAAEVAVEQADADVQIEQEGGGDVNVTEADPVVNIEEAEGADVAVEQAEAEVQIEETGDANVAVDADMDSRYAMFAEYRVGDLNGVDVMGETGNNLGKIDGVVMMGDEVAAVVGVGGFLGLGKHSVAIPLDELEVRDGVVVLNSMTESELQGMPAWDSNAGELVPTDTLVGDL